MKILKIFENSHKLQFQRIFMGFNIPVFQNFWGIQVWTSRRSLIMKDLTCLEGFWQFLDFLNVHVYVGLAAFFVTTGWHLDLILLNFGFNEGQNAKSDQNRNENAVTIRVNTWMFNKISFPWKSRILMITILTKLKSYPRYNVKFI